MSVEISSFVTWNSHTRLYNITRKNCKLDAQSSFAQSLKSKSVNTSKKATSEQLKEYYAEFGSTRPKKYKKININIHYNNIEAIIYALQVFVLSHNQSNISAIAFNKACKKHKHIKYEQFIKSFKHPTLANANASESKHEENLCDLFDENDILNSNHNNMIDINDNNSYNTSSDENNDTIISQPPRKKQKRNRKRGRSPETDDSTPTTTQGPIRKIINAVKSLLNIFINPIMAILQDINQTNGHITASRMFYQSLLEEDEQSIMAISYCLYYGIYDASTAEAVYDKYCDSLVSPSEFDIFI